MTQQEQSEVLEQDEVLKSRGFTTWNGNLTTENEPFAKPKLPLAGFSIIEAKNVDEVIQLVANTPVPKPKGLSKSNHSGFQCNV